MVRLQEQDFDPAAVTPDGAHGAEAGAIASFIGVVRRERDDDDPLEHLYLEHYPGMTGRVLEAIAREAKDRWMLCDLLIIHRYGVLRPGERIVLVRALSRHRRAALEAVACVMDQLKVRAPFWKKETYRSGRAIWVRSRASDDLAARAWNAGARKGQ